MENVFKVCLMFFLFFGCSAGIPQNKQSNTKKVCDLKQLLANVELDDWKKDSFGCQGIRVKFREELSDIEFEGYSIKCIIDFLGEPERVVNDQTYFYYLGGKCENNTLDFDSDKMYLFFRVKRNSVELGGILVE